MSKPIIWQAVFFAADSNYEKSGPNPLSTNKEVIVNYIKNQGFKYYLKERDEWFSIKDADIIDCCGLCPCYRVMSSFLADDDSEQELLDMWQELNTWYGGIKEKHYIEKYGKEKYEECKQRAISLYGPLKN